MCIVERTKTNINRTRIEILGPYSPTTLEREPNFTVQRLDFVRANASKAGCNLIRGKVYQAYADIWGARGGKLKIEICCGTGSSESCTDFELPIPEDYGDDEDEGPLGYAFITSEFFQAPAPSVGGAA